VAVLRYGWLQVTEPHWLHQQKPTIDWWPRFASAAS
jgi:hypothetical protein